jgi:epoxyqueuosine reductase
VLITSAQVQEIAHECGFEIAGVTAATPHADFARFESWRRSGKAGEMGYLTDRRAEVRGDPRRLLGSAQSIICLGKLYNTDRPFSTAGCEAGQGWISRYAWGLDYHDVLRPAIEKLARRMAELNGGPFESKICIDTAPLLERSYAKAAGLGWIGKNTCLINQERGSWFFLAELLVSIPIAGDGPAAERCGTCTRCIDACPTAAIVAQPDGGFEVDARLCISYLTIEKRGRIPEELAERQGRHVFGCDICQDVCPWNGRQRLEVSQDSDFAARIFAPDLAELAGLGEEEFQEMFRRSPIYRSRYQGFLRNVAIAMGNSGKEAMREPLQRLVEHKDEVVSETACEALARLEVTLDIGRLSWIR